MKCFGINLTEEVQDLHTENVTQRNEERPRIWKDHVHYKKTPCR